MNQARMTEVFFTTAPEEYDLTGTYNVGEAGQFLGLTLRQVNVVGHDQSEVIARSQRQLNYYMEQAYAALSSNLLSHAIEGGLASISEDRCAICFCSSLCLFVDGEGRKICRTCSYKEA